MILQGIYLLLGFFVGVLVGARLNICPNCRRCFLRLDENNECVLSFKCKKCGAKYVYYKKERMH